jgi:Ca2+-binding RTX toxin-like protein
LADEIWGGDGNDDLFGRNGDDYLDGEAGNDDASGDSGTDILLGGLGNDELDGGSARDIVIGGLGKDKVYGGSDDDLLIGGTTSFDRRLLALQKVLAVWKSADHYRDRIDVIRNGTGPILAGTGVALKKGTTVFDDNGQDKLKGSSGLDWFFYRLGEDKLEDKSSSEWTK